MMEENNQSIGERLLKLRNQKQMTQEDLAEYLDVSRQSVSKWELDKTLPDVEKLTQLSELYEVTIDYLVKGEQVQQKTELDSEYTQTDRTNAAKQEADVFSAENVESGVLSQEGAEENEMISSTEISVRKTVFLFSMIVSGILCVCAFAFSIHMIVSNVSSTEGKQQDVLYVERIYEQYTKADVLGWNEDGEYFNKKVWLDIPGVRENDYIGYYFDEGDSDKVLFKYYTETLIVPLIVSIFLFMITIVFWMGWSGYRKR